MVALKDIERLAGQIAAAYRPDRIVLFGSHARGTADENSDVDLLVVLPFEGKGMAKAMEVWGRIRPEFAVDLIVRRPDDIARRYREFDPLIRDAIDRGIVLYERDSQRVG